MIKSNTFLTRNSSGFSLVEVIVISGILSIIGLAMLTLTTSLQKQNKGLQQKLEAIQVEQSLTRLMTDNSSCQCMFANLSLGNDGTSTKISNSLKAGCSSENLVAVNAPIPNTSTGLRVSSIELTDIKTIDANKKLANIVINFDSNSLASSLRPIKLKGQSFLMSGTKISQCVGVLGTIEMCTSMGGQWTNGACQTKVQPASACTSLGGVWSNNNCQISAKPQESCTAVGGTWDGTKCVTSGRISIGSVGKYSQVGLTSESDPLPLCQTATWKDGAMYNVNDGAYCFPATGNECKAKVYNRWTHKIIWVRYSCDGSAADAGSGGNYSENSDRRLKKDIHVFNAGLKEALMIQPFQFKYNGLGGTQDDGKTYTGVMAQDLEKIIPGLVRYRKAKLHPDDEEPSLIRSVDYQGMTFVLLNSIKDQQVLIKKQQQQIEEGKNQINATIKRLEDLEERLQFMEKKTKLPR